jgi:hypothetical protein
MHIWRMQQYVKDWSPVSQNDVKMLLMPCLFHLHSFFHHLINKAKGVLALAAGTIATFFCNVSVNKTKVFVFNSDYGDKFTLNDSDIKCTHDLLEHSNEVSKR